MRQLRIKETATSFLPIPLGNRFKNLSLSFLFICNIKKIYHLSTCDTTQKILKDIEAKKKGAQLQDIKTEKITPEQLDEMKKLAGSYEALFSRKAIKYRTMDLNKKQLTEDDYRNLILEEYTFLKRPVAIVNNQIFIGNTKDIVQKLKDAL